MRRAYILVAITVIVVAAFAGFVLYKPPPIKIRIGYMPAASYGLVWVAYEKGYFAQEGLEVTLKEYPTVAQLVGALYSKEIDGAPITSVALAAFIKNLDIRIVAGNSLDGTALVTNRTFSISSIKELSGMRLGTVQYVPGDYVFKDVISKSSVNITIKEYLSPPDALSALESGAVDASLLWEPYASLANYRNLSISIWDAKVYNRDYPCCLQAFSESFIKSNPDAVTKFIRALIKAEVFAYSNTNESLPMVKKYLPGIPIEIVYYSIFYTDPELGRARNPLSAYINYGDLRDFYSLLVPSLISQNDYILLLSKIDLTYYQNALTSLKRENFPLPSKYAG
ncbi:MAG: ABC transporter substrate-binding protein [Candidatus Verstraetearchaeota archaeon]|nr:ABC transporter substrate-binding protein [Candidatus Verstraetearchaeota archaeon]